MSSITNFGTSFFERYDAKRKTTAVLSTIKRKTSGVENLSARKKLPTKIVSSEIVCQVNPFDEYQQQLRTAKKMWVLSSGKGYVISDCDKSTGALLREKYCIVVKMPVYNADRQETAVLLKCNCEDRIDDWNTNMKGDLRQLLRSEVGKYCFHARAIEMMYKLTSPQLHLQINTYSRATPCIQEIQALPLLSAVTTNKIHLITLKRTQNGKRLSCMTCKYGTTSCEAVLIYRTWLAENGRPVSECDNSGPRTSNFDYVSYKPIPHPLPPSLKTVYEQQMDGNSNAFPQYLIPSIPDSGDRMTCKHGCEWDGRDPITSGWVSGDAVIHQEHRTIYTVNINGKQEKIKVCYRPSIGICNCVLPYDGQENLLFNVNNHTFVHYGLLLSYLKLMKEARNPLIAFHRAYAEKLSETVNTPMCIPYHALRRAWNGYIRLLDIKWEKEFECDKCGDNPQIIICDGTSVGLNKELLLELGNDVDVSNLQPILGTKHTDRVFIPKREARKLLLQFAGVNPQSKQQSDLPSIPITQSQYTQLVSILRKYTHLSSLADIIDRISNRGEQLTAPQPYREFLKDIARNSPASSLLQLNTDSRARHVIKEIIFKRLDILQSVHRDKIDLLKKEAPIIAKFMECVNVNGHLPYDVRCMLKELLKKCNLSSQSPSPIQYLPVPPNTPAVFDDGLSFFPSMPRKHGNGNYALDANESRACRATDTCNKFSKGHPTLSPGIFTLYCQHKVCLGFEVMKQHESPAVPFKIIKQRFHQAPRIVVYDNGCKLHQYCLNREPEFFKNTMFLVDRLHWCNHTGCSTGYNMNVYKKSEIQTLNSQICEQTNAVIARIRSQLAYMLPDNFILHTALFLAMANMKTKGQ